MWLYSVCMSVLGPCKGIFSECERKKVQLLSLLLSFSGSLPSRLCSLSPSPHHLSVSHHCEGRKPRRASQPDLFNVPTSSMRCVRVHVCAHLEDNESVKEEKRREMGLDIYNSTAYLTWGLGEEAVRLDEVHGRHIARMHKHVYTHTLIPGVCPSLSAKWCYALMLTLWVNPSPHLSRFFFLPYTFSFSPSLALYLALSTSLQPSGWLAQQPWGV